LLTHVTGVTPTAAITAAVTLRTYGRTKSYQT